MTNSEAIRLTAYAIELKKENNSLIKMLTQVEPLLTFCPICKTPLRANPDPSKRGHASSCKLWKYCYTPESELGRSITGVNEIDSELGW